MKRKVLFVLLILSLVLCGCGSKKADEEKNTGASADQGIELENFKPEKATLKSADELHFHQVNGSDSDYEFTYGGETYKALYTEDNWKIYDSYRVGNTGDMVIICEELIKYHPIHGKDMKSYRTAYDMAYEWLQHNTAYFLLPESSKWKDHVRDVDIDPADQGRNLEELFEARTGRKLFSVDE